MAPVAKRLSELLGKDVILAKDIVGEDAKAKAAALKPGQILLLENCAMTMVRPRTIRDLQRHWQIWPVQTASTYPMHSVRYTAHMLPPQALPLICRQFPVS